ncbi:MAG: carbon-nitrogen hydrolase [Nitrospirae bacterium]|nr:carbon-nitrogen hydrolase [Nitrospirota bacterium]
MRIGLIQMSCSDSPKKNLSKACDRILQTAKKGARIVCLQELFRSRYFCQKEDASFFRLAETIPGESTVTLCDLARSKRIVIVAPVFEKRTDGVYHNSAVVIDADGTLLGRYRKMHIPDDPCYFEKFYFTPGDLGFEAFQTRFAKIGVLICWDQWFPEAARLTALRGAQILFYPTAIGWLRGEKPEINRRQEEAWEIIQRSHAVANGVFVAAANRVGREGNLTFWGRSFVSGPFGEQLAQASGTHEQDLIVECDLTSVGKTRQGWPFLRDRRVDAYKGLTKRLLDT